MDTKNLVKFYGTKENAMRAIGCYRQKFDYWERNGIPQMWQLLIESYTKGALKAAKK